MIALPVPLVVSLVLAFLLVRAWLRRTPPRLFLALLGACALQGVIVSLCQYYGITGLLIVQPVTATIIPPLAWLAFQTSAIRRVEPARDAIHLAAPAFTAFCAAFAPVALDAVVPLVFAGYGLMILLWLRPGADSLPQARLDAGDLPVRVWRTVGIALVLSACSDVAIATALANGALWVQPLVVSFFSSLWLLAIGALSLSQSLETEKEDAPALPAPANDSETALFAELQTLLAHERLYLDPDLTLARLAKRLHVPVKRLSEAVNRAAGENVSRHINGYRIRHACSLLGGGASVTAAMFESGFNTKSNFNREFLRVTGQTPSQWSAASETAKGRRATDE